MAKRRSKYGIRTDPTGVKARTVGGIKFDSKLESQRWLVLLDRQQRSEISNLGRQPEFVVEVNGFRICKYKADFRYLTRGGATIIEDVKGVKTAVYRLKKKLVEAQYGIEITEITKASLHD